RRGERSHPASLTTSRSIRGARNCGPSCRSNGRPTASASRRNSTDGSARRKRCGRRNRPRRPRKPGGRAKVLLLDTDTLTIWLDPRDALFARLSERLGEPERAPFGTTVVCLQEQMSGWLSAINRARKPEDLIEKYARLLRAHVSLRTVDVLAFDAAAQTRFESHRRQKVRIPTMDLRIACVTLVNNATLLTRNVRDFRQVPGLAYEDWSR